LLGKISRRLLRNAMLFRIRSTMVPIASADVRGCQGNNLVCQAPRSLDDEPNRWAKSKGSTMEPMDGAARQAPSDLR
jgi:hypothetical protein